MTPHSDQQPSDLPAAEKALERLRLEISATRRRREQAVADFEAFLRTTRAALENGERVQIAGSTPAPASGPGDDAEAAGHVPEGEVTERLVPPQTSDFEVFEEPTVPVGPRKPAPFRERSARVPSVLAAGLAALLLIWGVVSFRRPAAEAPAGIEAPAPDAGTVTPTAGSEPPVVAMLRAEDPARSEALRVELSTTDTVWLRVLVDGERVVEREVPANQRLRYSASRDVVIRAGNAGAVRAKIGDGPEQALGREGQVVTRTFTAPAR